MKTAEALVAKVAAATGPRNFPARIGLTAAALADTAEARFAEKRGNMQTLGICRTLAESREAGRTDGSRKGLCDEDAQVVAFFLAESTSASRLSCVGTRAAVARGWRRRAG